ncbi:PAS domain S-box protein [Rhodohalobacter sp. SW132]|uniref:PAS domain-containing protein n=1 Tax=Rhodohalobacter sp. SW132 TaxID=2293433 RepID=UPI000E23C4EE|nr:PAS domain-containing protein [Rhodohalobacter sp. SW132]REL38549.1 PAS domain S-box protein [Rhodohalobacter sp. SW132]
MSIDKSDIKQMFFDRLNSFLVNQSEENLSDIYSLGRQALNSGFGLLELLEIYHETTESRDFNISESQQKHLKIALSFLTECLAPYEMKQQGYEEMIKSLKDQNNQLKKEVEQRKQVENELKESKNHFQQLVENVLDIITILDPDGTIRFLSPSVKKVLGYSPEELQEVQVLDLIREKDRKQVRNKLQEVSEKPGNEISVRFEIKHKKGQYRCLESSAKNAVNALGKPGIIVNSRDVSERVKAFEKLEASREQLRKAQKIGMLGSWEWDIVKGDLNWSGELCDIYGIPEEEKPRTYKDFLDMMPDKDRDRMIRIIRDEYIKKDSFEFEHRIELPDGRKKLLLVRGDVIQNDEGKPVKMIGTGQDITRMKETERKLREYSDQLRQLSRKNEQVRENERIRISRKLHDELGQTLSLLKVDLFILQQKLDSDDKTAIQKEYVVEELKKSIKHVETTIKTVQTISRELRPLILDDFGLSEAICWQLDKFESHSGITTTFQNNTDPDQHLGEEETTAVFRILQESLTNILRHANASKVDVELQEKKGRLVLKVKDDGIGIRWDQLKNSKSLGILGMRERCALLGGDISFVDQDGKGTTVILTIPFEKEEVSDG